MSTHRDVAVTTRRLAALISCVCAFVLVTQIGPAQSATSSASVRAANGNSGNGSNGNSGNSASDKAKQDQEKRDQEKRDQEERDQEERDKRSTTTTRPTTTTTTTRPTTTTTRPCHEVDTHKYPPRPCKPKCNSGRGNGSERKNDGEDCDPGNSGGHNNGGD